MSRTLAELAPGESGRIVAIDGDDLVTSRLLEMGLTPGQSVRFVGTALLGDPLEIQVRGYRLSLRRVEATRIRVDVASSA